MTAPSPLSIDFSKLAAALLNQTLGNTEEVSEEPPADLSDKQKLLAFVTALVAGEHPSSDDEDGEPHAPPPSEEDDECSPRTIEKLSHDAMGATRRALGLPEATTGDCPSSSSDNDDEKEALEELLSIAMKHIA